MKSSTARIVTALLAAPVVIYLVYLGGLPFVIGMSIVAVLAQGEVYSLFSTRLDPVFRILGLGIGAALCLSVQTPELSLLAPILVVVAVALLPLRQPEQPRMVLSTILAGVVYPTVLVVLIIMLRTGVGLLYDDAELFILTAGVAITLWTTDSAAYFVGRAIGKKPLAPSISPGKTVEGFAGGVAGAVLAAVVFKILSEDLIGWLDVGAIVIICGLISPLGDLAESMLKRSAGVKDSGNLLPGHGGFLDRIDALIVALPLFYLYLRIVGSIA